MAGGVPEGRQLHLVAGQLEKCRRRGPREAARARRSHLAVGRGGDRERLPDREPARRPGKVEHELLVERHLALAVAQVQRRGGRAGVVRRIDDSQATGKDNRQEDGDDRGPTDRKAGQGRRDYRLTGQLAEIRKGVDAGPVAARVSDLERVLAHQRDVLQPEVLLWQLLGGVEAAGDPALAAAGGAGAGPAQPLAVKGRDGAVVPGDGQAVGGAVEIDRGGKRVLLRQRTLMTGSWRKDWIEVRAAIWAATSRNALAPAESGREITIGVPRSLSSRISV